MNQRDLFKALCLSALAVILCSCQGNEANDINEQAQALTNASEESAQLLDAPTTFIADTQIEVPEAPLQELPVAAAPMVTAPAVLTPPDPMVYYQDIFNYDEGSVDPWHANYVGSYGQLPTRFQDKGPFLYSFDVSLEAATSRDNNYGPMLEFFDHDFDDDDF